MTGEPVTTSDGAPVVERRRAARVVVVDTAGFVLMIQGFDPHHAQHPYWYTVGGGVEHGESDQQAAVREVWEETGATITAEDLLGPVHHDRSCFSFEGRMIDQEQVYYGWVTERFDVVSAGLQDLEVRSTLRMDWIDPATTRAGGARIYPVDLERLVAEVVAVAAPRVRATTGTASETTTRAPTSQNWL